MHATALPAVVPVVLIGLLSLLTPALTPRTVQFGVRIPAERAGDPVVTAAKHAGRWFEGRPQITATDTTLRTAPEPFPWLWALPAVAITVATAIVGVIRYPRLPPRLVSHYDTAGHPTSYSDKTFVSAFAPVLVQVGVTVLIVTLARVTARGKAALDVQDPHAAARHRASSP